MTGLSPTMEIQGSRDLTTIAQVILHPQWVMPEGVHTWLPALIAETIVAKHPDDHPKKGQYKYSMRARQRAQAMMMKLHQQNAAAPQRIPPAPPPTAPSAAAAAQVTIHNTVNPPAESKPETVSVQAVLDRLTHDPEYIDFLRSRATGGDTRIVGQFGESRPVEDSSASGVD